MPTATLSPSPAASRSTPLELSAKEKLALLVQLAAGILSSGKSRTEWVARDAETILADLEKKL